MFNLLIVKVNSDYSDYLRKFDNRVSYNKDKKELRPFVGVLFRIEEIEYFAPLTSPKPKHLSMRNTIDFYRVHNGEWGAINFNNMIPVTNKNYEIIDLNQKGKTKEDLQYHELLNNQYVWLNEHKKEIMNRATKLYQKYINHKLPFNIRSRCCNYKLLEDKCLEYNKVFQQV